MVNRLHQEREEDKRLYQCPECFLSYREEAWALKCEAWCTTHDTCNLEITDHAIESA